MKCSHGHRCDLLNTRLVVDSIEKEYYCLSCAIKCQMVKDKHGNITWTEYRGIKPETIKWNVNESR